MWQSIIITLLCLCWTRAWAQRNHKADSKDDDWFFQFVTRPDIAAPRWDIITYDREALQPDMYWFVSPYASLEQTDFPFWNGPHIYDTNGELIWSGAPYVKYTNSFDFRMSMVDGQQMLSFVWPKPQPDGNGFILDSTYEVYEQVDMMGNHTKWNMHEFNLINDGKTALMGFPQDYQATNISVDGYMGPCRIGWQGFKEVDVKSGEVLFEFNTKGHVSPEESNYVAKGIEKNDWEHKCAKPWDITHVNAVDKFDDGDYLFSARHTDTIYKVSHIDHSIVWRLGGSMSDFVLKDQRAKFSRQHHVRFRGQNATHTLISLFDNAAGSGSVETYSSSASWGLHIALRTDVTPMTAELVARFEKPLVENEHDFSKSRGSVSFLPNGNAFVGWVTGSHISEHTPDGRLLQSAMMSRSEAASYRSYKMPWVGRPAQPPDVFAAAMPRNTDDDNMQTTVHVSWNGATEVATWNVLHTNSEGNITQLVASSPRQGFETKVTIDGFARHVIAVALDINGRELGRSKSTLVRVPPEIQSPSVAHVEHEWLRNHSSSWWEPAKAIMSDASINFGKFEWFVIGFICCVVILVVGVIVFFRKRTQQQGGSWWRSRRQAYNSVAEAEDEEMNSREWMLDEKEDVEKYIDGDDTTSTGTSSRHEND